MVKIYHNPRCSKSREANQILQEKGLEYEVIEYIKNPISKDELKELIQKLGIEPLDLVRQKEEIWRENYSGKELSADEIINAMIEYPRLMERPIVVNGNKAVIGRPPSLVIDIL